MKVGCDLESLTAGYSDPRKNGVKEESFQEKTVFGSE